MIERSKFKNIRHLRRGRVSGSSPRGMRIVYYIITKMVSCKKNGMVSSRAGNMGRAQWADPNWPDILEGQVVKLAA